MAKLTLSADADVIARAKKLAKARGTSVSAIFSHLVRGMSDDSPQTRAAHAPMTRKAIGLIHLPDKKSDRELIEEALIERYGR